jgi:long-chain acyl-CoA synthetase
MNLFEETKSIPELALCTIKMPEFKGFFYRVADCWEPYNSERMQDSIYYLSLALRKVGVGKDVGVGVIAPSSPKWFMIDIAAQICGGYVVPLFSNISSEHFEFQVRDACVKILVIDSWDDLSPQISRLLDSIDTLVHFSDFPQGAPKHRNHFHLDSFVEMGKAMDSEEEREKYSNRISSIEPSEVFSIIYTSGSTGTPKGVPLTQKNMMVHLRAIAEFFPLAPEANHVCMSILPVAHVFERMAVLYFSGAGLPI